MNGLKAILFGAAGLFLVLTLMSLLITAKPRVARMVVINTASKEKVMTQLTDLANWKNWHPVFAADSVTVRPSPGTRSFLRYHLQWPNNTGFYYGRWYCHCISWIKSQRRKWYQQQNCCHLYSIHEPGKSWLDRHNAPALVSLGKILCYFYW